MLPLTEAGSAGKGYHRRASSRARVGRVPAQRRAPAAGAPQRGQPQLLRPPLHHRGRALCWPGLLAPAVDGVAQEQHEHLPVGRDVICAPQGYRSMFLVILYRKYAGLGENDCTAGG